MIYYLLCTISWLLTRLRGLVYLGELEAGLHAAVLTGDGTDGLIERGAERGEQREDLGAVETETHLRAADGDIRFEREPCARGDGDGLAALIEDVGALERTFAESIGDIAVVVEVELHAAFGNAYHLIIGDEFLLDLGSRRYATCAGEEVLALELYGRLGVVPRANQVGFGCSDAACDVGEDVAEQAASIAGFVDDAVEYAAQDVSRVAVVAVCGGFSGTREDLAPGRLCHGLLAEREAKSDG